LKEKKVLPGVKISFDHRGKFWRHEQSHFSTGIYRQSRKSEQSRKSRPE